MQELQELNWQKHTNKLVCLDYTYSMSHHLEPLITFLFKVTEVSVVFKYSLHVLWREKGL